MDIGRVRVFPLQANESANRSKGPSLLAFRSAYLTLAQACLVLTVSSAASATKNS